MVGQYTGGAEFWDERYREREQLFSGNPNGVLVAETSELSPGQALDVGCGEGADALWLARRGWCVTAIDVSRVALERAASAEPDVNDRVSWIHGDPTTMPPPAGAFDLVSVHYFPLEREPGHAALRGLVAAVAPGGTLLYVGHDPAEVDDSHDVYAYYQPGQVGELLDADWVVESDEIRDSTDPPPEGTHHHRDLVLRARRLR